MSDKPAFDPSAPFQVSGGAGAAKPEFDPTKPYSLPSPVAAAPSLGAQAGNVANAAMRGVAQGSTFGFGDEAYGLLGAIVNPTNSDKGFSDRYHEARDYARGRDAQAHDEHPAIYNTGLIGGGIATGFVPGASALNLGKGAGAVEAIGKGAAMGGLAGAGNAKEITDVPGDVASGLLVGGITGGAIHGAGKVVGAVADKLKPASVGSVLLNAPEGALQRYIDNPEAVNAARSRAEIVQDEFIPRLEGLKKDVIEGSAASRAILANEAHTVPGSHIADILDQKAQSIIDRSEGVMDDPSKVAAVKWLQDLSSKYRPPPPEGGVGPVRELTLSTNRVKDLLQTIDQTTEYSTGPGEFSRIDDLIKQDIRAKTDDILKSSSAAYAQQMKHVHEDTMILKEVAELAKSPQGFDNLMKRTQRGTAPHLLDAIRSFDERTGGGLLQELENSAAKDALAKGAMNGSRNVNFQGKMGETIGEAIGGLPGKLVGKAVGYLGGATADKYGPAMAKGLVDNAASLQANPAIQAAGQYVAPVANFIGQGNKAAGAVNALEAKNQEKRDAINRRIGK